MDWREVDLANRALNGDMAALKDYVTAKDHLQYTTLPEGVVALHVRHQYLKAQIVDIRLDLHMTIAEVKEKLYRHVGTSSPSMILSLLSHGELVARMDDESRKLGYYGAASGMEIFIEDNDPFSLAKSGWLENVDLVEKYEMTEEEYNKRSNTVRAYKRDKLKEDPNWKPPAMAGGPMDNTPPGEDSIAGLKVGDRCEVQPGSRRGTVMYLGLVDGLQGGGHWVGVKFDEPVGKGEGVCKGKRYFECQPRYGAFVRGKNVTVGEFPVRDILSDLEDDEDEL